MSEETPMSFLHNPQASGSSKEPTVANPQVAAVDDTSAARPHEAGAVGGDGPPPPSDSRFEAAAVEADEDFNNSTTNKTNQKPKPQPQTKNLRNPNDKYFTGDQYPRYLVIKHKDPSINIATQNSFLIGDGLRTVLSPRQVQAMDMKYHFHSRLILVDVDGRSAAEKLLAARELGKIPVKVEIHQTKNTIKGTMYTTNFLDFSDAELLERLKPKGVVDVVNIPKRDKSGKSPRYFLTFAGDRLPERINCDGLPIKIEAIKSKPRRCPKCQEFGHGERNCTGRKTCCKCGKQADHAYSDCPNQPHCSNCGQDHAASSPACPLFQVEAAVIRHKEATNVDFNAARQHILRTHDLVNQIPKLRQQKAQLPTTVAEATAVRKQTHIRPIQHNNPPPPPRQPDLSQLLKPLENKITQQSELISQQARTIETLRTCMLGMINAPAVHMGFDGSLQDLEESGVINPDQRSSVLKLLSSTVDQATSIRKSRSRSRRPSFNSRESRSKSNKSPLRKPMESHPPQSPVRDTKAMESQPSTPSQGEKRKAGSSPGSAENSPDSSESRPNKAEHTPGKKVHRAKSSGTPGSKERPPPPPAPPLAPDHCPALNLSTKGGQDLSKSPSSTAIKDGKASRMLRTKYPQSKC